MGHVVANALQLIGLSKTPRIDSELRRSLDRLADLAARSPQLTNREQLHVKAVQQLADGYCGHSFVITYSFVTALLLLLLFLKYCLQCFDAVG